MRDLGLTVEPGSRSWWLLRQLWFSIYIVALLGFVLVFVRFERVAKSQSIPAWLQVTGATLVCAGLSLLALMGFGGDVLIALSICVVLVPFPGAAIAGVNPLRGLRILKVK